MMNLECLLRDKGHEVAVFAMDYPENVETEWSSYFPKNMSKVMAFTRPFGSREVKKKFRRLVEDFKPEVVHLNNVHTQLSPVMAEIAHERGIRVVWTLHDYKLLCPRYDCLKGGKDICEECFSGDKSGCMKYKCMKGSMLASMIGYRESVCWNRERLERCTDVFICPSSFMAEKMIEGGFRAEKMKVLCNFIDVEKCRRDEYDKEDYYCYVGRLSHEKGVRTLIEAANSLPYRLKIIGGGPLEAELKGIAKEQVEFVGYKQWDEIKSLVGRARFSVIPSEWYENNPLSVIEAQCLGSPVLGARIGGIPELIEEGRTGMTFVSRSVQDLSEKIDCMWRRDFDSKAIAVESCRRYNADAYYNSIMNIYNKNIN